jgi:hypothetical protein
VQGKNRQGAQDLRRIAVEREEMPRLRVPQPDLADSFRKAKAALEDATRDIAALRRRAGDFTRRSG